MITKSVTSRKKLLRAYRWRLRGRVPQPVIYPFYSAEARSDHREPLPLEQPLQREFYGEMCCMEGWSVEP
jgi:hypothetical protein